MELVHVLLLVTGTCLFVDAMHGGKESGIEKVPYMAEVYKVRESGFSLCGAVILSEEWLLTASHCVDKEEDLLMFEIRVGANTSLAYDVDPDDQFHNVSEVIPHESFSLKTRWNNDIALIKLLRPIEFSELSQPIGISRDSPKPGDIITLTGYGYDYDLTPQDHLKIGEQTVISLEECRKSYRKTLVSGIALQDKLFCTDSTAEVDACHGDSGSPAVLDGKLVGIVDEGCESPLPNIYVDVTQHCDWINEKTGLELC